MKKPPAMAMAVLMRLGAPPDDSIVGDLLEEYQAGRSRLWFWRQALSTVALSAVRGVRCHPMRAIGAVVTGWAALILLFMLAGDRLAEGAAGLLWNWDRQAAYGGQPWWPFHITAWFVSYAGFGMSAWIVASLNRRHPAMLLAFVTSVVGGLAASAVVLDILMRRSGAVPLPHALFYIVSEILPYHWRSGFLLVPLVMLLAGAAARRHRTFREDEHILV